MDVMLAKNIGFCSGVKRIIHLVEALAKSGKDVYYYGSLIHNSVELARLNSLGIREFNNSVEPRENTIVVTRAHGTSKKELEMLRKRFEVLDGTCPKVLKIHQMVDKAIEEGYRVFVYGNERHAEVLALKKNYGEKVRIVSGVDALKGLMLNEKEKFLLISQTTMMKEDFEGVASTLKSRSSHLKVYNTICEETLKRQAEAVEIAKKADIVLVIGGKNSSNTNTLVKIAQRYNAHVFHIEDERELFPEMFMNANTVGVLSGTSTPIYLVKRVIEKVKSKEVSEVGEQKDDINRTSVEKEITMEYVVQTMDGSFPELKKGVVVEGVVKKIGENGIFVDFGYKTEGFIPQNELLEKKEDYEIGKRLKILILSVGKESEEQFVRVSEKRVRLNEIWKEVEKAFKTEDKYVEGMVVKRIKGGYSVLIDKYLPAFLPTSHKGTSKSKNLHKGKEMKFKLLEVNRRKRSVVVSRKLYLEEEEKREKEQFFANLKEGDVIVGKVKNKTAFGAFVDIGPVDGLLHVSEISWDDRKNDLSAIKKGEKIKVVVKAFDPETERVSLSIKRLTPDPWESVDERYSIGAIVEGKVTKIVPFGALVSLEEGVEGLLRTSEIFWGRANKKKIKSVLQPGMTVKVEILSVNKKEKKIALSLKRVKGDPWENILNKYEVGKAYDGTVTAVLPYGALVELEDGVEGLVHISEMSWKHITDPSKVVKKGERVSVKVLGINKENKRMFLSLKRLTEDPWKKIVQSVKPGAVLECKVVKVIDTGCFVSVGEEVEGFIYVSQLSPEGAKNANEIVKEGDILKAKVRRLEYDPEKDIRKMNLSVVDYLKDKENEDYAQFLGKKDTNITLADRLKLKEEK